jgi:hypothetical protein
MLDFFDTIVRGQMSMLANPSYILIVSFLIATIIVLFVLGIFTLELQFVIGSLCLAFVELTISYLIGFQKRKYHYDA